MEMNSARTGRILVPLDGSDYSAQALPRALALLPPGGTLVLCHILAEPRSLDDGSDCPLPTENATSRDAASSVRAQAAPYLLGAHARVEVAVAAGDPGECILALAKKRSVDTIVMSSHGRGAALRLLFGSVAEHVVRSATLPVVVVHPTNEGPAPDWRVRRLVVPLDDSAWSQQAIPMAAAIAKQRRLPVLLIAAVDPSQVESPLVGYAAAISDRVYDNVLGSMKHDTLGKLERAGARLMREGVVATWRMLAGQGARVIPAILNDGDVVVMASQPAGGSERWWRGSLAEELIRSEGVPVMVVPATVTTAPSMIATADTITSASHL